jgi:hypothetical protein
MDKPYRVTWSVLDFAYDDGDHESSDAIWSRTSASIA